MKTPTVIITVIGVHVVAIGAFIFAQGCGTTRPERSQPPQVVMPPVPPPPPRTVVPPPPPRPPRPVVSEQPTGATSTYVIARGDTLSQISSRFGVNQSEVMRLNNITNPNLIRVGQKLILPGRVDVDAAPARPAPRVEVPAGASTYTVVAGDSLSVIAQRHGTTTAALREANNLTGDLIRVGQQLVIPAEASRKPAPEARPATPAPAQPQPRATEPRQAVTLPSPEATDLMDIPAPPSPRPTPPAAQPRTPAGRTQEYTVSANEDVYSVAMQWGVSVADLKEANNLSGTDLAPGQVLKIPLD